MAGRLVAILALVLTVGIDQPAETAEAEVDLPIKNTRIYIILGGVRSAPGKWPWIALLLVRDQHVWKDAKCGGSLISEWHVLTAAHCVKRFKRKDLSVRLGEFDRTTFLDCTSAEYEVSKITIHPKYVNNAFNNDLAILKLSKPAKLSGCVQPIRLPFGVGGDLAGQNVSVAGWGSTTKYRGRWSHVLREVSLPAVAKDICRKKYLQNLPTNKFTSLFPGGFIGNSKLCAGTKKGGKGACSGDSGGPMVIRQKDGHPRLVGVVSGGSGCGLPGFPTIYTRVNAYIRWILRSLISSSKGK